MKYERLTLRTVHGEVQQLTTRAGILNRLAELEDKIEGGKMLELSDDILTKLLRCVVFKCKYSRGNNYFEPFKSANAFGQPQIISMDELLLRTVIGILGIENQEQAEARLKELQGE